MPDPRLVAKCQARCGSVAGGRWKSERLIGMGGMAAVYLAQHDLGRREAVKILHPEFAGAEDIRQRFEREALAVNQLRHPGAVDIRDMGVTDDGCPFLVMELLEGENLRQRLDRLGDLPRDELLGYVDELLDVLGAAHAAGIIHRDIKLDNLFATTDGRLKVLDFGIAQVRTLRPLTRMGELIGTLTYMAPEQVAGIGVDARTDLFAVGATMFRVIAKRRLHDASSDLSLALAMGTSSAPPIATVAPVVDHALAAVVDRALQFRKEDRFQSAAEMQAAVRACRASPPVPAEASSSSGATAPVAPELGPPTVGRLTQSMSTPAAGSSDRRVVTVLGAMVVLLALALVAVVWSRPRAASSAESDSQEEVQSKKKKKRKKKAHDAPTSDATTRPSEEARSPFVDIPAKDFLAGASGEVPVALKKQFGADARYVGLSVMPGAIIPSLAPPGSATIETYTGHATFEGPIVFERSRSASDASGLSSFTLDAVDFGKLPAMVKDARSRAIVKPDCLPVVYCSRGPREEVQCIVSLDVERGPKSFEYDTDGTFRQKR